jgi:hypothetical protein
MAERNTEPSTCLCCKCHVPPDGGYVETKYGYKVRCIRCTTGYRMREYALGTENADEHFRLPQKETRKERVQRLLRWIHKLARSNP